MSAGARLLDLLPAIFRARDAEEALAIAGQYGFVAPDAADPDPQGPLTSLLAALEAQLSLLEAQVDNLYEDQFIETCAEWAIPYVGALVGARIVDTNDSTSARRQVADTVRNRRSKGTAGALARIGGAIMNAPAEAIEYREHLVVSLNPDFPGDGRAMSAAVNGPEGRRIGLSDYLGQRSVELRDMRERGRFAAPNLGVRVWSTPALAHQEVVPTRVVAGSEPRRFRFSPLGSDLPLWRSPGSDRPSVTRLSLDEMPGPIPLRDAVDRPRDPNDRADAYYGADRSVAIFLNGTLVPLADVCFCDLSDGTAAGTWNHRGSASELGRIRIDPRLGRFTLPAAMAGVQANALKVRYHYGMAAEAGGGGYADPLPLPPAAAVTAIGQNLTQAAAAASLAAAAGALAAVPLVRIDYGGTIAAPAATALPPQSLIVIAAGNGVWPTLDLAQPWSFTGGGGSTLILAGLRLTGDSLAINTAGLAELVLIDCTLVPGVRLAADGSPASPGGVALNVAQAGCRVRLERCIVGAVRVEGTVRLTANDSIIDSASPNDAAIAGQGNVAGGVLSAERSTFIGDVSLLAFDEVSNSLFLVRNGRTGVTPPVAAEQIQQGCVRYSALPPGSRAPRRYRCYPPEGASNPLRPVAASLRYGEPAYATLVAASPREVLAGAEGGGEMGVMNRFSWHVRATALGRELPDWTPFSMVAGVEMMSE
jgi:hypothetical protein